MQRVVGVFGLSFLLATHAALADAPLKSPFPEPRPTIQRTTEVRTAGVTTPSGLRSLFTRKPKLCGVKGIAGRPIDPIKGTRRGCGLTEGVQITEVHGIALSQPANMDCNTARALAAWVKDGVVPAVGKMGGGLAEVEVVGHYVCRTRNHKPGAKISEHGKGRAVDVAGFTLKDGTRISVQRGWRSKTWGPVLKAAHKSACGPFGTVLGPRADRYHQDHFHMDTARYRTGPYCR